MQKSRRRQWPVCGKCGHVLNPRLEDDCEKYFLVEGVGYCVYFFGAYLRDEAAAEPERLAQALGVGVVWVET